VGRIQDTAPLYCRADLLLLTSDHEGTPNVVLESMASALPFVGTAVGDSPLLAGDGARGRVAAPGDAGTLGYHVNQLVDDPGLRRRLGTAGRSYIAEHHSPAVLLDRLAALYNAALSA
jgi:glycosyltransferase involved in cell wall biosynthesis